MVLEPRRGWQFLNLHEIWRYRELLYFLVWRDVKVRYKQTALGAAWAVLQPFVNMVVFSLFFGRVAADPFAGLPGELSGKTLRGGGPSVRVLEAAEGVDVALGRLPAGARAPATPADDLRLFRFLA